MHLVNSYFWFAVAGLMAVFIRIELAEPGRGDAGRGRP
jgi:heme/copper-type cytochrome/quinol oxidase subunit 1